jgi:phage shock protein C
MQKRIYRSKKESMIAGVCGGLGEYLDIDPVIVRIIFVLLAFAGGAGVIGYIIAWIIIPEAPAGTADAQGSTQAAPATPEENEAAKREKRALFAGFILIALGLIFLFSRIFRWFDFWDLWPIILIIIGLAIVLKAKREKDENPASA